jgi:hypothetical protein
MDLHRRAEKIGKRGKGFRLGIKYQTYVMKQKQQRVAVATNDFEKIWPIAKKIFRAENSGEDIR